MEKDVILNMIPEADQQACLAAFIQLISAIYQKGVADGKAQAGQEFGTFMDDVDNVAMEEVQAEPSADSSDAAEPAAVDLETPQEPAGPVFDPISYSHAQCCTPKTLCGVAIDHSIEVFSQDDLRRVTCPRCLNMLNTSPV